MEPTIQTTMSKEERAKKSDEVRPVEDKGRDYSVPIIESQTFEDFPTAPTRSIRVINDNTEEKELEVPKVRAGFMFTVEENGGGNLHARLTTVANSPEELALLARFIMTVMPDYLESHPEIKAAIDAFDANLSERVE